MAARKFLVPATIGTIADAPLAAGSTLAAQNTVLSDSIHQTAPPIEMREGTPLLVKMDHNLDYSEGAFLGPSTSLAKVLEKQDGFAAGQATTLASGSNGDNIALPATWTPAGELNVASTSGFAAHGLLAVTIGGVDKYVTYTAVAAGKFTGCTVNGATGTLATGQVVTQMGGFPRGYVTLEGVTTFTEPAGLNAGGVGFIDMRATKNEPGVDGRINGHQSFQSNHQYIADGADVLLGFAGFDPTLNSYGHMGVSNQPFWGVSNGGTLSQIIEVGLYDGPVHLPGTQTQIRWGTYIDDADATYGAVFTGYGDVDVQVAHQVNELVSATENIAFNYGDPDPSVEPLFRIQGSGMVQAQAGVAGDSASGGFLYLTGTSHATKGQILLDAPQLQIGYSSYTFTGGGFLGAATNLTLINATTAITMNASGGAAGTGNSFAMLNLASTVTFAQSGSVLASATLAAAPTFKNDSGNARSLGSLFSVFATPIITADNAAVTALTHTGFYSAPVLTATGGSGALTVTQLTSFHSPGTSIGTGVTVTNRTGLVIADAIGSGTLTTQVGIDIAAFSKGATNIGIRNASTSILSGGLYGSAASGGNLSIGSTTHATKGTIQLASATTSTGGSLTVGDGTAGDGSVLLQATNVGFQISGIYVYKNTADTQPIANFVSVNGAASVNFGPGGSTGTDVSLARTGAAAALFTGVLTLASPVLNTGVSGTAIDTDSTFAANSDTKLASQKAVKTALATKIDTIADPNADRILFWDDSAGVYAYLTAGTNLTITGTTIDAAGGTPANDSVTNAILANMAVSTIKGRVTAGTGDPEDLSVAQVKTLLGYTPSDITAQPLDSDLTTIAGLTATTDNFIVSVASAWASRTPAQVRTTLGLVIGTNVQAWDADLDTLAGLTATTDNFIVSVGSAWASRTPAQVKTTLALNNVDNTADASKTFAATAITSATMATARLGSGSATSGTFLRGDSTWQAISGGGDMLAANNLSDVANAGTARTNLAVPPIASPTFTGITTAPEFSASGLTGATAASRYVGATTTNAPVSGTFAVGDFAIAQTGEIWLCTVAGTPGTWTSLQNWSTLLATFQLLDSDLTTIAGLTATTNNFIVSVGSAWASRTPAQVMTTLAAAPLASPTLVTPVIGVATGTSLAVTGLLKSSSASAGVGYATGAGGAQTQATNKTTTVTLNAVCGQITMNGAALGTGGIATFTLTNSAIGALDTVLVNHQSAGTTAAYNAWVSNIAAGSCSVSVRNMTGGSLSEAIVLSFAVIKTVAS